MPKTRPLQQQRKRRVRISKDAPFPVPIATVTGETASNSNWIYYTATLHDHGVTVHHSGDMEFLYRMGFFGKGSMSRGQPLWVDGQRVATLPSLSQHRHREGGWQGVFQARVTSRRRYMTHLQWHLLSTGDASTLTKAEQDLQVVLEEPTPSSDKDQDRETYSASDTQNPESRTPEREGRMETEEEEAEPVYLEAEKQTYTAATDWGEGEGDAEFWGAGEEQKSPVSKTSRDDPLASWDNSEGDAEFWGTADTNIKSRVSDCSPNDAASSVQRCTDGMDSSASERTPSSEKSSLGVHQSCSESHVTQSRVAERSSFSQLEDSSSETSVMRASPTRKDISEAPTSDFYELTDDNSTKPNVACSDKTDHADVCGDTYVCAESSVCEADPCVEWSEFCHDNDDVIGSQLGQVLFVMPDSDEEERTAEGQVCRSKTRWKSVVKLDPFPVREHLHLSWEEAFFLSYGLGCLSVLDSQKVPMHLERLWRDFCQRQPDFVPHYIAYHHYRSKNWVPKTGLKFGCTFLLYKDGPPFYHGSYSVVVKFVDAEGKTMEGFREQRQFSWTSLAGLKRITEHVGKELMICYVIKPPDLMPQDMLSPACIPRFQIKEVVVSRWVSAQEREGKGLEDLP